MRKNKIFTIGVRVTSDEKRQIEAGAKEKKMLVATFVRECALNGSPREVRGSLDSAAVIALNRIGNNLNQIAKTSNTMGKYNEEMLEDVLRDLAITIGKIG